jgi:hypothetical protein
MAKAVADVIKKEKVVVQSLGVMKVCKCGITMDLTTPSKFDVLSRPAASIKIVWQCLNLMLVC